MSRNAAPTRSDRRLRWTLAALAAVFAAFSAYGSFVPLDFKRVALADAIDAFARTPLVPLARASRSDFITNVLLFVPIGFFMLGALGGLGRQAYWLFVPVVAACLGLSVAIEFGQIFVSGRTPSWNDVLAETIGGSTGAALWIAARSRAVGWSAGLMRRDSRQSVLSSLLGAYVALWLLLGVLPLDFTIRPQELAEKFRAGRIVLQPFGGPATLTDNIGIVLMALPVGAFGVLLGAGRRSEWPLAFGMLFGGLAASGLELVQVLAVSRTADVTDVVMNLLGIAAGALLVSRSLDRPIQTSGGFRLWPLAALSIWCLVLIVRHWTPFDFVATGDFVRSRAPIMFRVPFHSYYWGMPLTSLAEAITKLLLAVPVGVFLQLTWMPETARARFWQAVAILLMSAGIFLALEAGQLLLPSRVPDQTDVYLGVFGSGVGMAGIRLLRARPAGSDRDKRRRGEG